MIQIHRFVLAVLGCLAAAVAAPPLGAGETAGAEPYERKETWAETMLASRANLAARLREAGSEEVALDVWHATDPLAARSFDQRFFPEDGIDLEARDPAGEPLWRERPEWADGTVHNLPAAGGGRASTYLYRQIRSGSARPIRASFGSDDGIEVWLNGAKLLSDDSPHGVAPDQYAATLDLRAGENALLVKIHNGGGGHGFYFSPAGQRSLGAELWALVRRDFPAEAAGFERHVAAGEAVAWLAGGDSGRERGWIDRAISEAGEAGRALRPEADALVAGNVPADDPRWLSLVADACALASAVAEVKALDLAGVRRAIDDLRATFPEYRATGEAALGRLDALEAVLVAGTTGSDPTESARRVADTVRELASTAREALLANPLLRFEKLLVVRRDPGQLGLPQNWQGNCALPTTGYDNEIAVLSPVRPDGRLTTLFRPDGGRFVGDVDLDFGGDRMAFSMPGSHGRWQIWEIRADGTGLRQVTPGADRDVDNYDPCYRPDGRIIFGSTACFQGVPCVGGGNTVANLFVMDPDGTGIRQLCFDQDHDWCPAILPDGRVMYTRWEYSDTPHYFSRILFSMNPDGTSQMALYGSNSYWPNSLFYARPIPGHPSRLAGIVSGHHGVPRMGELVVFDPAEGTQEAAGAIRRIPERGRPVSAVIGDAIVDGSWPRFLHPYPLSEKYFLVSSQPTPSSGWGIYLVDIFDNSVLVREERGAALLEPVPFRSTPRPPVIPDRVDPRGQEAVVYLSDIYRGEGLRGVPRGTVKKLRLCEFHYSYPGMGGHINVGVEGPWDVRRILGTVDVAPDGSASFKVPANMPISVQPLDAEGKALQVMRSWFTAMPGEKLSCVGCHEPRSMSPPAGPTTAASGSSPAEISPWYGPPRGFSFRREVQPVLDRRCVGCHDGSTSPEGQPLPDFRSKDGNSWGNFTPSYLALHPFVRRPGPESDYRLQAPMEFHADTSELVQMLRKGHHGVQLDAEDWDRIVTWIDLNVPDHGTWTEHRTISADFHRRRIEARTLYANRPEDPEAIPQRAAEPVSFVRPEPAAAVEATSPECAGWPFPASEALRRQAEAGPSARRSVDLGDGVSMDLVLIPAGEFVLGDARGIGDADERPAARVSIPRPFWMGATEVTNAQYARFAPGHSSGVIDQHNKDHNTPGYPADRPQQPVIRISFEEATAFCAWLSTKSGERFALPSEAEWEWACRAGSDEPFAWSGLGEDFSEHANLADFSLQLFAVAGVDPQPVANPNPFEDFLPKDARFNDRSMISAPVGRYRANAWGLLDMHGNVAEWTRSTYRPYPWAEDGGDGAAAGGGDRVVRGGSWRDRPRRARASSRLAYRPYQPVFDVGFRVIVGPR